MPTVVSFVSQKGGVGKSSHCRTLALEYTKGDWDVRIADMDTRQATSQSWNNRRFANNKLEPKIAVQQYKDVKKALKDAENLDLLLFDGAPNSTIMTLEIAKVSDLVILPTGTAIDDLEPSVILANTLVEKGISKDKIVFLLTLTDSEAEVRDAKDYIKSGQYEFFKHSIKYRTGYKKAADVGKALTETTSKFSRENADLVMQEIINRITQQTP